MSTESLKSEVRSVNTTLAAPDNPTLAEAGCRQGENEERLDNCDIPQPCRGENVYQNFVIGVDPASPPATPGWMWSTTAALCAAANGVNARQALKQYWDENTPTLLDMEMAIGSAVQKVYALHPTDGCEHAQDATSVETLQRELYARWPQCEITFHQWTGGGQLYIFSRCGGNATDWAHGNVMTIVAGDVRMALAKSLCRMASAEEVKAVVESLKGEVRRVKGPASSSTTPGQDPDSNAEGDIRRDGEVAG